MAKSAPPNQRQRLWGADRKPPGGREGQMSFADQPTWGGPRKNAGRKPGPRRRVPHVARPEHLWWKPTHVTMRRARGLPSLRSERIHGELRKVVAATRREDFRIVHYSVQRDHVHMVVEADDALALASGMKSFTIRAARRLNTRILKRRGAVWGDRYHRRDLASPREVRNALVYVMNNHLKHHEWNAGLVDECSSAPWFTGWMQRVDPPPEPNPAETPQTWLLERGWHDDFHFIHLGELPRALRA